MSVTNKFTVTFNLTTVIHSDAQRDLIAARGDLKALVAAGKPLPEVKGPSKFVQDLFVSEKTDEEVIVQLVRTGARDLIHQAFKEECRRAQNFRVGDVSVKEVVGE